MFMKTILSTLIMAFSLIAPLAAQSDYEKAMQQGLQQLEAAERTQQITQAANYFERIALAEPAEWLPAYYAAYTRIRLASMESSDKQLDLAQAHLRNLMQEQEEGQNAEVVALQGYLHMIRVALNPAERGQTLAPLTMQTFQQAMAMDIQNPRPKVLLAQMQYGTAQFFQSEFRDACTLAQEAASLYQDQGDTGLMPAWGADIANYLSQRCTEKYGD